MFNNEGKVIGIHCSGSSTTSYELRVEYIRDAMEYLVQHEDNNVPRGDIGLELEFLRLPDAILHYNFPVDIVKEIRKLKSDIKYSIVVHMISPKATCSASLKPGDIVVELDGIPIIYVLSNTTITTGEMIKDNIYKFDKIVNGKVGKTVNIVVFRNGERIESTIPVIDTFPFKIRKFVICAGTKQIIFVLIVV
ncbi:hypothetical protein LCGC14_1673760 [marine sediment metagenome]|uniref:PDZ domain-containing protein n=1 Tax=marine sediment metagenome TaxID=412755 RepID=A0A0F9K6F6_9ZZZZ